MRDDTTTQKVRLLRSDVIMQEKPAIIQFPRHNISLDTSGNAYFKSPYSYQKLIVAIYGEGIGSFALLYLDFLSAERYVASVETEHSLIREVLHIYTSTEIILS